MQGKDTGIVVKNQQTEQVMPIKTVGVEKNPFGREDEFLTVLYV